ncbi:MAG: hypothetical protein LBK53_01040 [Heliobacteriaceae bacterium]|jgi:hypothetical protein|nr:hypothetical protein [Heliobacteriaceae bacterium]
MSNYISEGLDKIFKDEYAPPIHSLTLVILCAIIAVSLYPEMLVKMDMFQYQDYKTYHDVTNTISSVALILFNIYIAGYNLIIINRSLKNEATILPDIDNAPYKVFFNYFPAQVYWFIYYAIIPCALCAGIFYLRNTFYVYTAIPVALLFLLFVPFLSFIPVCYAKNFDKKGLFDIRLPFRFIKMKKELYKLIIQFAPLWFLAAIFVFLTYYTNLPSKMQSNVTIVEDFFYQKLFVMDVLSAYLEIILTFLWSYCIARVFAGTGAAGTER